MNRFAGAALCLLMFILLAGCGDDKGTVEGTVTFDDQPVKSGIITFVKSDGALAREGAVIKDGKFKANVPPGRYKVELSAQRVAGTKKQKGFDGKLEEIEITEELFPERFNTKSELSKEIKPGSNEFNLDLKSKK
ncbi:peptidase associated/transthyretin-like domain-containing protein [Zavarzinella formosa]|uniref:carboxypeptidase regulatory-like domain-containing protein n=1 Tax=Zavarzinella formosa TaxID=360055 RepID=UPI0002DE72ED|nr:carboxypeptidase regulatory-like domain-containing protein [Zavarzinella formosa]